LTGSTEHGYKKNVESETGILEEFTAGARAMLESWGSGKND